MSFFTGFLSNNKTKNAEAIKGELLEAIAPLDRGAEATPEDQQRIDQVDTIILGFQFLDFYHILLICWALATYICGILSSPFRYFVFQSGFFLYFSVSNLRDSYHSSAK